MESELKYTPEGKGDAQAIIEHVTGQTVETIVPRSDAGDTTPYLIAHGDGMMLSDQTAALDRLRPAPLRKSGTHTLHDQDSLKAFIDRHATGHSVVYADEAQRRFTAILDHHEPGIDIAAGAGFGRFRAVYECPLSNEWKKWREQDGIVMNQGEFAEFLEDRIIDVSPSSVENLPTRVREAIGELNARLAGPSEMMTLSRGLSINADLRAEAKVDVSSGQKTIKFEETHTSAGEMVKVPDLFIINVSVFQNGAPYLIPVRLRYRVSGGSIKWFYQVWRPDAVLKDAFDGVVEFVSEANAEILRGAAPEVAPVR